jgi:hypothetical protein
MPIRSRDGCMAFDACEHVFRRRTVTRHCVARRDAMGFHTRDPGVRRARARCSAAATAACRVARSASTTEAAGRRFATRARAATRALRAAWRTRAAAASCGDQAWPAGAMVMQSTGQGSTHNSQPEQSDGRIACMRFCAPMIASTGHAWMHNVQPMHAASSMIATRSGPGSPHAGSSGVTGRATSAASATTTSSPPGGQRFTSAAPPAIASAYGRQPA